MVDRYRYWTLEAIVADLDTRRHDFHVAIENWQHDFNIGTIVRTANAFLAGDLFNLFVGFEMLLFASYVLLTLGGTGERVRAGSTYVVVSLLSSTLFLIAMFVFLPRSV